MTKTKKTKALSFVAKVEDPLKQLSKVSGVVRIRLDMNDPNNYLYCRYNYSINGWEQLADQSTEPNPNTWVPLQWSYFLVDEPCSNATPSNAEIMRALAKVFT
jgi:hypothetical protein